MFSLYLDGDLNLITRWYFKSLRITAHDFYALLYTPDETRVCVCYNIEGIRDACQKALKAKCFKLNHDLNIPTC